MAQAIAHVNSVFLFSSDSSTALLWSSPPDPVQGGHAGNPAVMVRHGQGDGPPARRTRPAPFPIAPSPSSTRLGSGPPRVARGQLQSLGKAPPPSAAASKRHRPRSALPRLNHASALLGDSAMALPSAAPAATKSPAVDRTSPRYARPPQNQALKPRRPANSFSASLPYSKNTSPNNCTAWGSRESAPNRPCNYRAARSSWPDCK